jgi:plastocyanin
VRRGIDQAAAVRGITEVAVHDNVFEPRAIEVQAGTEVTWNWTGDRDHNVVGGQFQSTVRAEGDFAHRFDRAGTFDYVCTLHGGMTGRVVVVQ